MRSTAFDMAAVDSVRHFYSKSWITRRWVGGALQATAARQPPACWAFRRRLAGDHAGVSWAGALAARFSTYPGGRGGKERAARHERSSDWPRGRSPLTRSTSITRLSGKPPEQTDTDASASRGARQGRLLSEALRRLAAGVDRTRTVLLFGNHTTPSTADHATEQTSGGRALPSLSLGAKSGYSSQLLIREVFGIVAIRLEATTVKTR